MSAANTQPTLGYQDAPSPEQASCASVLSDQSLDAVGLVVSWRVHLRRNRRHLDFGIKARVDNRIFTGKPRLEAVWRQHHRHAGMQIADAFTSFTREDGAGQHAVFPALPKAGKGQGQAIAPCDVKGHFRRFRLSRDFQAAPVIKARGRNEAAA